jgi:DNA-binding winged helix-turn-helix (wHTH) protein
MGSAKRSDDVELDLGRYELRRAGRAVRLEKKAMDLLIFLVSRRDLLVPRSDIVAKLWGTDLLIDTERNINNQIRKIRTALRDDSAKPRFLETVVGKGYRFIGPVRVVDARPADSESRDRSLLAATAGNAGNWSDRSSLAVLPLSVAGNMTDESGYSLGFADALVARLGNLQGIDVLPTSAVLNVPAEATALDQAARLGVRFVVHGAMQASKGQLRVSVEMLDAHARAACFSRKRDLDINRLAGFEDDIARQIAGTLKRPLRAPAAVRPRYSQDPMAYTEFMRGYRLSASGDPTLLEKAAEHLANAVTRDPAFSLAHATLSWVCTTRHFELDPASVWLEKAEFHCRRSLELDPNLPEGHVASAVLLWGPSKNFQHLEAIGELKRALALQSNLPHAYNRLGTILAHIGLLDHARAMYERGRPFHPNRAVSHSIVQVYIWTRDHERATEEIAAWRAENPTNKYPLYFGPQTSMMIGDWEEAQAQLDEAARLLPEEPLIVSLQGVLYALTGRQDQAFACLQRACANPRTFGHAHHSYYQIACILAVLGRRDAAFEWLERSVSTGFACWPYFLKDPCLESLRGSASFDMLVSSLQAKYPDHLGLL